MNIMWNKRNALAGTNAAVAVCATLRYSHCTYTLEIARFNISAQCTSTLSKCEKNEREEIAKKKNCKTEFRPNEKKTF